MKYGDLIQFDPIEVVIQLREADANESARRLVSSFVFSAEMVERLAETVFPNLQFTVPLDNKGILVVGNYGTGKSHLLSVLSTLAEDAEASDLLRSTQVAQAAAGIAGRFKVVRSEIGAVTMPFREFVCRQLEEHLDRWGIHYRFPPQDQIPNHKGAFEEMMAVFHERFPDQGILLAVDELLDFLRHRNDQELILDLNFLREVGEVCKELRFRFMAGVQESIFDSGRFAHVAENVRRVKDRFEQVLIARRDISFVVAERLLKKTPEQKAWIREHLLPYARFYENLNERMDEFVRLFPVHPDYIDAFQRLTLVEQRQVLRTISNAIKDLLGREVPMDGPGLFSYDQYWPLLKGEPSFRSIPEVREVSDCSTKLEELMEAGFPKGKNLEMARRIIRGLSIHRLVVGDIEKPVGLTAENLRDQLCLFDPLVAEMGGEAADDLRGEVETSLRLISRTVNGQFISATERDTKGNLSGQFYLDVKKTVDYEGNVTKRAESLDKRTLDRYYYNSLSKVLECSEQTYVQGYRIWEHELEWTQHRVSRRGYLFFGSPNQRSTATPPRDFYLYFIQPYEPPLYHDEKKPDEVFFRLTGADDVFGSFLKGYAAASELATTASGQAKSAYEKIAGGYLRQLNNWLQDGMLTVLTVTHQGKGRPFGEWLKSKMAPNPSANVRDLVNGVGSVCLAPWFTEQAPEYPIFSTLITGKNREQAAQEALRWLRGTVKTKQGAAVLDALELLDGDKLQTERSRYADYILELLRGKAAGQVLNREAIITENWRDVEYMAPGKYRLEPEWVVVVLAALVYSGDAVLVLPGKKFDAGNLEELTNLPVADLVKFKHLERPKDWNMPAMKALFELLGLAPGLAVGLTQGQEGPVRELQAKVGERLDRLVRVKHRIQDGIVFWGMNILPPRNQGWWPKKLEEAKAFLESVQNYSTPAQFKNFRHEAVAVQEQGENLAVLEEAQSLLDLAGELEPLAGYLSQAEMALPSGHPWLGPVREARELSAQRLRERAKGNWNDLRLELGRMLATLKQQYIQAYALLHGKSRLGQRADGRKAELLQDDRLVCLNSLATLSLLPKNQLKAFQDRLAGLTTCFGLKDKDLEIGPVCPHCGFVPATEAADEPAESLLDSLDGEPDRLIDRWTGMILDNLEDPTTLEKLDLLSGEDRAMVEDFLRERKLPQPLPPGFIRAVQEALSGLEKVMVSADGLRAAIFSGGAPATPAELRRRFDEYIGGLTRGKDQAKIRLVVE